MTPEEKAPFLPLFVGLKFSEIVTLPTGDSSTSFGFISIYKAI